MTAGTASLVVAVGGIVTINMRFGLFSERVMLQGVSCNQRGEAGAGGYCDGGERIVEVRKGGRAEMEGLEREDV